MKEYVVKEYEMKDYKEASDKMTNADIINLLEYIKRGYLPDYNYTGSEEDFENYKLHAAIWKAIQVLE